MAIAPLTEIRRTRRTVVAGAGTAALVVITLVLGTPTAGVAAEATVGLATAGDFSVLAASTVTNTGTTTMGQSLGVHPGNTVTGAPAVGGETHLADAEALQAKDDLTTAYVDAAGRTPFTNIAAELGGSTLIPGVYRIGAAQLTGELELDAQGDPQAVFIFQVDSTLTTAPNSSVVFINGVSSACNVFWQIGSSATLDTGTDFIGTVMAADSVTMNTGAVLEGRALAQTGAVTLDSNVITESACSAPTSTPTGTATATPTSGATTTPASGASPQNGSDDDNPSDSTTGDRVGLPVTGDNRFFLLIALGSTLVGLGVALRLTKKRRRSAD